MNKKVKVLVTGGLGYIGSHTVVELINEGYEPVIVDNLVNSSEKILDQIAEITGARPEFYNFDLTDQKAVMGFVKNNPEIKNVIHFAAYKAVGESVREPVKYYENNLFSLINILKSFGDRELNIIFSSSCTVYGQPEVLPVTEDTPLQKAESPYGSTKQICEGILSDSAIANKNLKVISLRYFNPVGAHESGLIGELPIGVPQSLVPFVTQSAIGKCGPVTVFGTDYSTKDGSCVRDYIHVSDLAQAHINALDKLDKVLEKNNFEVLNIGTGDGKTVLEVIHKFEEVTGVKLNYLLGNRREGDVEKIWADPSRAKKLLNFEPKYNLDDMMRTAWKWEEYLAKNPLAM